MPFCTGLRRFLERRADAITDLGSGGFLWKNGRLIEQDNMPDIGFDFRQRGR